MDSKVAVQNLDGIRSSFSDVEELQLIFELINGRETPLGIVQAFIQHSESETATSELLERVQSMIIRLAVDVPFAHSSLVALLEAFYHCADREIHTGIWGRFGMDEGDLHSSLQYEQDSAVQYININSFEAQLWRALGRDAEDYILGHPIRNLARAIEQEKYDDGFQTTNAEVASACLCKRVWHLSKNTDHDSEGKDWRGDLWTGERGYSVERWGLWKKRFQYVAEGKLEGVGAETRRLAAAAVTNMNAVEAVA